jgi:hypothetical protein
MFIPDMLESGSQKLLPSMYIGAVTGPEAGKANISSGPFERWRAFEFSCAAEDCCIDLGSRCIVSVPGLGANFLEVLLADFGGVAVWPLNASSKRRLGFRGVTVAFLALDLVPCAGGSWGDEDNCLDGSTGGKNRSVWTL